jgi:hypothetical protein
VNLNTRLSSDQTGCQLVGRKTKKMKTKSFKKNQAHKKSEKREKQKINKFNKIRIQFLRRTKEK